MQWRRLIIATLEALQSVQLDAGTVFSGQAFGVPVNGYAETTPYTPRLDPDYCFQETIRDVVCWFLYENNDALYLTGPTGSGKSSGIRQIAARLRYPTFEVTGHGRLELADLLGHLSVHKGTMEFEYGPLALAMRYGGLFLLDEIDLIFPDVTAGLNAILDGSPLCLAENGGELIEPHPMFRFAATANTAGSGDESGLYSGAQRQNLALMDRFMVCEVGYPSEETEIALLTRKFPDLPRSLCSTMVVYANEIRKLFVGGSGVTQQIEVTFSTRSLIRWADLTIRYQNLARQGIQPIRYALDRALGFRASRETRAMMGELCQRMFPTATTQSTDN